MPPERSGGSNLEGLSDKQIVWYEHMMKVNLGSVPNLEDFQDIYPLSEIKKDCARVERRKQDFSKEADSANKIRDFRARLAEFLMARLGGTWLGGKVSKTSEFDDYTNGVDLVFETIDETGFDHHLSIDITTGLGEAERKLRDIGLKLKNGELSEVKYFKSQFEGVVKSKIKMSKVMLYFENLDVLAKQYYIAKTTTDPVVKERAIKFLGGVNPRLSFITQVVGELTVIRDFLLSDSAKREMVDELEWLLNFFNKKKTRLQELSANLTKVDDIKLQSLISSTISTWRP